MLQSHISYQFKSPVWRLEIDAHSQTLFAEIRDQDDKKVFFASVNLESGKVNFDELQTEERWLTGIEAGYKGVLLLHNYQTESGPAHKGLIAFDGESGSLVWNNYTHAFDHLSVNGPVIYDTRMQPRMLYLADIKTGRTIRLYEPSIDVEEVVNIILPEVISTDLLETLPIPVVPFGNTAHYLEHNNLRIVSLHAIAEGTLQQWLYIMDGANIIYEDILNTDIQKLQPESFLIHGDQLICLKNKSELKVLNL